MVCPSTLKHSCARLTSWGLSQDQQWEFTHINFPRPLKLPTCSHIHTHKHTHTPFQHLPTFSTHTLAQTNSDSPITLRNTESYIHTHTSTQYMCTFTHVLDHMYSDIYTDTLHTHIISSSTYTWPLAHNALLTSPCQSLVTSPRGHADVFGKTAWTPGYSQQKIFLNCKLPCGWFFVLQYQTVQGVC